MTRRDVGYIGKIVLGILFVSAAAVTLATFPGLIQLLPRPRRRRKLSPWEVRRAMIRLQEKQLVQALKRGRVEAGYVITERGRTFFEQETGREKLEKLHFPSYKPWDGWWRVIAFDIPERRRPARDALRAKLRELGCYSLQKSVLVTPSPCEEEMKFLCDVFDIHPYVSVFATRSIPKEEQVIRRYFEL